MRDMCYAVETKFCSESAVFFTFGGVSLPGVYLHARWTDCGQCRSVLFLSLVCHAVLFLFVC